MKRRQVITAIGAGALTSLGGCLNEGSGDSSEPEPLDGEWILRARIRNQDEEPREWRVESRSQDRESLGAAWSTIPGGETRELELRGQLFDEQREVYVESDTGSIAEAWRPADCRRLFADVTIVGGNPQLETECREE